MLLWLLKNFLSVTIFLPLVGVAVIAALPRAREDAAKYIAVSFAIVSLLFSLALFAFVGGSGEFEMMIVAPWIPTLGRGA